MPFPFTSPSYRVPIFIRDEISRQLKTNMDEISQSFHILLYRENLSHSFDMTDYYLIRE